MKTPNPKVNATRLFLACLLLSLSVLAPLPARAGVIFIDIPGPANSTRFGATVTVLPNGNFVVTDPSFNAGTGAVYLYNPDRVLLSTLTGGFFNNAVGSGGITVLANGNFVVRSPSWGTVSIFGLGAVTWCSQVTGCNATVSAANSLVGSKGSDSVGSGGVIPLPNGHYVVVSPSWDNGAVTNAGAVTWANGLGGTLGAVSPANSLVGNTQDDFIGNDFDGGVTVLSNSNYLVRSPGWNHGAVVDAGAITWANGAGGTTGPVSADNSLVGITTNDGIGHDLSGSVTELANGNYVVRSATWDLDGSHPDVGVITWGSGTSGVTGVVSSTNSLVGRSNAAPAGSSYLDNHGVIALANGNYVISSPNWSPSDATPACGAVTWGSGTSGVTGAISASNSLVGSRTHDYVGETVVALTNGNYVVGASLWDLDSTHNNVGAVTWGDGATGIRGLVSAANSLLGNPNTVIGGDGIFALANGNYVVSSPAWSNTPALPANVGAVTWGDGDTGITGVVSTTNSLVGSGFYDAISDGGVVPLANGNYVVISRSRANNIGTVTWVKGSGAATGVVSNANSLVGSVQNDRVGSGSSGGGVTALPNGNYLVRSPWWDNGAVVDAGALTWGDGLSGITGAVSAANSIVGSTANDQVCSTSWDGGLIVLADGDFVVSVPQWDNGAVVDAGAVRWGSGASGAAGPLSAANSLVGSSAGDLVGEGSYFGAAGVTPLANGDYLVNSPHWSDATYVGAVTWGNGSSGTLGPVSALNSLLDTSLNDETFMEFEAGRPAGWQGCHPISQLGKGQRRWRSYPACRTSQPDRRAGERGQQRAGRGHAGRKQHGHGL